MLVMVISIMQGSHLLLWMVAILQKYSWYTWVGNERLISREVCLQLSCAVKTIGAWNLVRGHWGGELSFLFLLSFGFLFSGTLGTMCEV